MSETINIPTHLGFILDGNRRWAREHGLSTFEGHQKGYENLKDIAKIAFEKGVGYVSAYVFSTENWNRSKEEVGYLMDLALKIATKDVQELLEQNIRVVVLGSDNNVPSKVAKAFKKVEEDSKNNTGGTLALCFNYGGFQEITDSVKQIVKSGLTADEIDASTIADNLYYPEIPPVDLVVRTSGEQRISNFMLWRAAYAELLFVKKHWPDFNEQDLNDVLHEYTKRNRRFGGN